MFKLSHISAACALALAGIAVPAQAQISGDVIRIGFITDMSGLYADIDGPAGAEMIRQAVADMGGTVAGKKVEVLVADYEARARRAGVPTDRFRSASRRVVVSKKSGAPKRSAISSAKVRAPGSQPRCVGSRSSWPSNRCR